MISRRRLVQSLVMFGASASGVGRAFAQGRRGKALVVVFLRGGVDGLSMVPPVGDPEYSSLRPSLRLSTKGTAAALPLDGTFALHPALAPLLPRFTSGQLAVIHATGLPQSPRSHFDAQDFLEAGTPGRRAHDGWLNRAGAGLPAPGPFSLVAVQNGVPSSLAGEANALAFPSLKDFRIGGGPAAATTFEALYEQAVDDALRTSGHEAFESLSTTQRDGLASRAPENGATYPRGVLGRRLQDIARLIHADVGLSLAATELGGFDTHLAQGAGTGQLATRLEEVGQALAALAQDLGPKLADVTLLTMTEFGRTARENGTRGTDHGTASASLVLGGGVKGGRVVSDWPSLAPASLHEGRDLRVTTDLRNVMTECLESVGLSRREVFPDFTPTRLGLFG
jgi:uncharacterized protein (DUF1501 family)